MNRVGGALVPALLAGLLVTAGPAGADPAPPGPADPAQPAVSSPADQVAVGEPVAAPVPPGPDPGNPVADACKQFGTALDVAALNYEDFAYATAGNGNDINYQDPTVERSNVVGRTALRAAAAAALDAARTPGIPPEVSDPMQSWSLHATKLIVIMGVRGGGDALNSAATQLNTDGQNAQMACALAMAKR